MSDVGALYFTALTLSLKLRAVMAGIPVSLDINTILSDVKEHHVEMKEWPRFISNCIFSRNVEEFTVISP